ncbi:MAG: hypothetical protein ACTH31_16225, partial [Pseudoclavibacter sp.]
VEGDVDVRKRGRVDDMTGELAVRRRDVDIVGGLAPVEHHGLVRRRSFGRIRGDWLRGFWKSRRN